MGFTDSDLAIYGLKTMKDVLAIHRMLLEQETKHEIVRLPRAITDAAELPEVLGLPPMYCLRTRIYNAERLLAAVIVTAGQPPSLKAVRAAIGAPSARLASVGVVNARTGYAAGLVAPLLLLPETVSMYADQAIVDAMRADDVVYTATGEPCTALAIRAFDLFTLCGAKPVGMN